MTEAELIVKVHELVELTYAEGYAILCVAKVSNGMLGLACGSDEDISQLVGNLTDTIHKGAYKTWKPNQQNN